MAMLTAVSLIVFVIEAQIPPIVPIPGVKLGIANMITLTAMLILGRREAGVTLAYLIMCLTLKLFPEKMLWVVSIFGAIAHNAGQLAVAIAITKTSGLIVYVPVLAASAIVTGAFTGLGAMYVSSALRRLDKQY